MPLTFDVTVLSLWLQVACGEQHNLARVLPSRKALSKEEAELYVWGGGRLGQVSNPGFKRESFA